VNQSRLAELLPFSFQSSPVSSSVGAFSLLLRVEVMREQSVPPCHSREGVLLYIGLAVVLVASCRLEDTWGRCCSILRDETNSTKAAVADSAVVEVLALQAHFLDGEGALLIAVVLHEWLFLGLSAAAWPRLSWPLLSF
jgi:hypothetical protein